MITKQDFTVIDTEVRDAINEVLDKLKNSYPNDYVLFLARGEYMAHLESVTPKVLPYTIEANEERYKDDTRFSFLTAILNQCYSFPPDVQQTEDIPFQMNVELMVYTHIWATKSFLKELYRLAHLANGEEYNWNVAIPDMGKHDFIRNDIRTTFDKTSTKMGDVIKKSFHTSLRNAFAHSEFYFNTMNNRNHIVLDNYGGAQWELKSISFDDWSKRFVYSALLSFYLLKLAIERKKKIVEDFNTNEFVIKVPLSKTKTIVYDNKSGWFNFKSNLS